MANFKYFQPSEEQIKSIEKFVSSFLEKSGYKGLSYGNNGVFKANLVQSVNDVGDIRVSWETAGCTDLTVVAQQIENEKGEFTMRQWNPAKPNVGWNEENDDTSVETSCPMMCVCCFFIEKLFKGAFPEILDYCEEGSKTSE